MGLYKIYVVVREDLGGYLSVVGAHDTRDAAAGVCEKLGSDDIMSHSFHETFLETKYES
jgi:hypothetical protein